MSVSMLWTIFIMILLFEIKHLTCDFMFQNAYMLGKFKATGWVLPLSAHCAVNAIGAAIVAIIITRGVSIWIPVLCFCIEFTTHFVIDRWKASPNYGGKYGPTERMFWINLGIDQMLHRVVNCLLIFIIPFGIPTVM